MSVISIISAGLSILVPVLTIIQIIVSFKKNKQTEQKSNQQALQINNDHSNNIDNSVENSSTITYNYTVNRIENINIEKNKSNEQENNAFIAILSILVGMVISVIVFSYFHLCFFSFMIAFTTLYACKNIYHIKQYGNFKKGIKANKCKIIIFLISIVCCIFYWLPLSSPPNYPKDIFNFATNISSENISNIINYWPSLILAFFQFLGSVCFIFSHSIPYINSCYYKLKKKFKLKTEISFKYTDKIHIVF